MLRPLLEKLSDHPDATALRERGGRAFVSLSLRAALVSALADADPDRPTVVVAGDDRHARELAADMRAWLKPRTVRFYPTRGVTYESHLTPPAHLTGLRVAALDALAPGARVVVLSYHSLEDRIAKRALAERARSSAPIDLPVELPGTGPTLRLLSRGAEQPGQDEVDANPRAASVRLRAAERIRELA